MAEGEVEYEVTEEDDVKVKDDDGGGCDGFNEGGRIEEWKDFDASHIACKSDSARSSRDLGEVLRPTDFKMPVAYFLISFFAPSTFKKMVLGSGSGSCLGLEIDLTLSTCCLV